MSRELERAARKFADATSSRFAGLPLTPSVIVTVYATSPLTVYWRGSPTVAAAKNRDYTPAINDRVLCLISGDQLIVVCPLD